MPSVRRIASQAGVSVATVSRALNNHPNVDPNTRRRVIEAAESVGYPKNLASRANQTNVVALAYAGEMVRADYGGFDAAMQAGILRGLNEHRFDLRLVALHRDAAPGETYARVLERKQIGGTILRVFEDSRQVAGQIAEAGLPCVVIADRFPDALKENGIELDPAIESEIVASTEGGAGLITRLMSMPKPPTAVFFTDPLATVGALRRCLELGVRVPQDLSIVGFDDSDVRKHTFPACTSVVQDAEMLGFEAARWLTRRLANPADENLRSLRVVRTTRLEINQTTGRPPVEPVRVLPDGSRVKLDIAGK